MNKLELIAEFKEQLGRMSYYNASDSDWGRETSSRNNCKKELKSVAAKLLESHDMALEDLKEIRNKGQYLVTTFDFLPDNKER